MENNDGYVSAYPTSSMSSPGDRYRASKNSKKGKSQKYYNGYSSTGCPICCGNSIPYSSYTEIADSTGYSNLTCQNCGYSGPDVDVVPSGFSDENYNKDAQVYRSSSDVAEGFQHSLNVTGTSDYEALIYVNKTGLHSNVRVGLKQPGEEGQQPYAMDQQWSGEEAMNLGNTMLSVVEHSLPSSTPSSPAYFSPRDQAHKDTFLRWMWIFNDQDQEWQAVEVRVDTGALGRDANTITQGAVLDYGLEGLVVEDREVLNQRVGTFVSPSKVTTMCRGSGAKEFTISFRVVPRGATDSKPHLGLVAYQTYGHLLLKERPQKSIAYTAWGRETEKVKADREHLRADALADNARLSSKHRSGSGSKKSGSSGSSRYQTSESSSQGSKNSGKGSGSSRHHS